MSLTIPLIAMIVGTFALRLIGPALRSRMTISPRIDRVMSTSVAVVFVALIATSTLLNLVAVPAFYLWRHRRSGGAS